MKSNLNDISNIQRSYIKNMRLCLVLRIGVMDMEITICNVTSSINLSGCPKHAESSTMPETKHFGA